MAQKPVIEVTHSTLCEQVAKVLESKGFIHNVKVFKPESKKQKMLHIELANTEGEFNVTDVTIVSKPGRRVYAAKEEMKPVYGGFGVMVVSTSKGVMDSLSARTKNLGGEIICKVR